MWGLKKRDVENKCKSWSLADQEVGPTANGWGKYYGK